MWVMLLQKRILNEDLGLLNLSNCLDRWMVQDFPGKELGITKSGPVCPCLLESTAGTLKT